MALPHPIGMLNHSWYDVVRAALTFLESQEKISHKTFPLRANSNEPIPPDTIQNAIDHYRNFIYEAVRFVEDAADNLKKCLLPKQRWNEWKPDGVPGLRKHSDMICNKLKHEHNRLIPVSVEHMMGWIEGYSVCAVDNDGTLKPNRFIHDDTQAFSYNVDIRRIVANIYLIGESLGHQIRKLTQSKLRLNDDEPEVSRDLPLMLEKISSMPIFVFPKEKAKHMPIFSFDGDRLTIDRSAGKILTPVGWTRISARFTGDGFTKAFHIF